MSNAAAPERRDLWRNSRPTSISGKLHTIVLLSLIAVWVLAFISIHFSLTTSRAAENLFGDGFVGMSNANKFQLLIERHRRIVESAPAEVNREVLLKETAALARISQLARRLLEDESDKKLNALAQPLEQLIGFGDHVMGLATNLAQDTAVEVATVYAATGDALQEQVQTLVNAQVVTAELSVSNILSQTKTLIVWVSGIGALMLLCLTPVSIVIIRGVSSRLRGIMAVMIRLARNDTSVQVPSMDDKDEVGEIARAVEVFKVNAIELDRHQSEVQAAKILLDAALANMPHGLSMFDRQFRLLVCNRAYAEIYRLPEALTKPGVTFEEIQKHRIEALSTAAPVADGWLDTIRGVLTEGRPTRVTREIGDGRTIEVSYQPLQGGGWVAVHEDVTMRRRTEAKIEHMANHDALTGLPNRAQFRERLTRAVAELQRNHDFAVFCLDLDHFKQINDTLGHAAGDLLLREASSRVRSCLRKSDVVARLGGDEFAIIQFDASSHERCSVLATRIIETVGAPYNLAGNEAVVGVSIGVALAPADDTHGERLLQKADMALYAAKEAGRCTHRFFDPEMDRAALTRRTLEQDLRKSFIDGGLELHYQPIVDLSTRHISGFEALLRWHHPQRGMISPAEFIPIAEETGQINAIGEWVIRRACAEAARWPNDVRVAVNLSPAQFRNSNLCPLVVNALASSGIGAHRLELEITESVLLLDSRSTLDTLHQLRKMGVRIAMDDFGTGYSSLSYLRSFPFDKIKIDQSFVRDLANREDCIAIVRAIAGLASSLKMSTVAEGVETEDQMEKVVAAGCTEAQGWYFGRPMAATQIAQRLAVQPRVVKQAA